MEFHSEEQADSLTCKLQEAATTLLEGGVIICPTEGVYGLSALATNTRAIERIIHIKRRALNKGLIVVASSTAQCDSLCEMQALGADSLRLIHEKWPGHATFIMPAKPDLPPLLTGQRATVAVRVTAFPLLAQLINLVGQPVVSTSANISGSEPLQTLEELRATFENEVDYILDEPCQGLLKSSTIYDARSGAILRP